MLQICVKIYKFIFLRILKLEYKQLKYSNMTESEFLQKISKKIVELRQSKELSQEELARKLGWHRTAISRIESGQTDSSITKYWKVAEALGLSLSELIES
jgi:ribosome-binding protein aMBF1 (putative translation factor)